MNSSNFLRNAIQQAIGTKFRSVKDLAEMAGVNQGNLSSFMKAEGEPNRRDNMTFDNAWKILHALGLDIGDVPTQEPVSIIHRLAEHSPPILVLGANQKAVSVFGSAGAGSGVEIETAGVPLFEVMVPADSMFACDYALLVEGQSMEPTIKHKTVIGVDQVTNFIANELYVACIPYEGYVVKRVAVDREVGEFVFKSDNPDKNAYPDFREPIESATKIIMGRVVWVMHRA